MSHKSLYMKKKRHMFIPPKKKKAILLKHTNMEVTLSSLVWSDKQLRTNHASLIYTITTLKRCSIQVCSSRCRPIFFYLEGFFGVSGNTKLELVEPPLMKLIAFSNVLSETYPGLELASVISTCPVNMPTTRDIAGRIA